MKKEVHSFLSFCLFLAVPTLAVNAADMDHVKGLAREDVAPAKTEAEMTSVTLEVAHYSAGGDVGPIFSEERVNKALQEGVPLEKKLKELRKARASVEEISAVENALLKVMPRSSRDLEFIAEQNKSLNFTYSRDAQGRIHIKIPRQLRSGKLDLLISENLEFFLKKDHNAANTYIIDKVLGTLDNEYIMNLKVDDAGKPIHIDLKTAPDFTWFQVQAGKDS